MLAKPARIHQSRHLQKRQYRISRRIADREAPWRSELPDVDYAIADEVGHESDLVVSRTDDSPSIAEIPTGLAVPSAAIEWGSVEPVVFARSVADSRVFSLEKFVDCYASAHLARDRITKDAPRQVPRESRSEPPGCGSGGSNQLSAHVRKAEDMVQPEILRPPERRVTDNNILSVRRPSLALVSALGAAKVSVLPPRDLERRRAERI